MRRSRWMIAAATMCAMALAGCNAGSTANGGGTEAPGATASAGTDSSPDNAPGGEVTIGLVAEPASLDFTTTDGAAIPQVLLTNIYETLVKVDQDGKLVPSLAKEWTVSDDNKTYTFTLVDDATFTNGEKFTAKDAVFSINYVKNDWVTSVKSAMDVVADVKANSDTELEVTLTQPSNSWLYKMATTRIGAMMTESGVGDLATTPVGTGPYVFESWNRGDSIVLKANPDYWGEQPGFDTVTLRYFKDPTALNNALLTGSINVISTVQAPESLGQFENNDKYAIIEGMTNGEIVLSMNHRKAPFDNLQARQAVRHAIDHQALMDTCWAGKGTLIGSMVPPTDPWYEDRTGDYPFDLDKAKSLLEESGQAGTAVDLKLPQLPYAVSCGQVVKSMLEDAGFTVNLSQHEFPAQWLQVVFTDHDYNMSVISHVEPRDLGHVFANPDYYPGYDNAELQDLLAKADAGTAEEEVADLKAAAKLLSEDAAADFLFLLPNLMVADKDIAGLPENAITESFDLSRLSRS